MRAEWAMGLSLIWLHPGPTGVKGQRQCGLDVLMGYAREGCEGALSVYTVARFLPT